MVPIRLILLFLLVVFSAFLVEKEKQSLLANRNSKTCIGVEESILSEEMAATRKTGQGDDIRCVEEEVIHTSTRASLIKF
jgi:hypothetical protein